MTKAYITVAGTKMHDWTTIGWGPITIYNGFAHSSDTFFYQVALKLGIDRLGYWAHELGFGRKTGIDLPGETVGTVPTNDWKQSIFSQRIYPGETSQAGIGQGYDMVTPSSSSRPTRRWPTAAPSTAPRSCASSWMPRARSSGPSSPRSPAGCPSTQTCCGCMRVAARNVLVVRHTYNFVDLPIVIAGKSGTAEYSVRDSQGRLPFHSWFVGFMPKDARKKASDPDGFKAVSQD